MASAIWRRRDAAREPEQVCRVPWRTVALESEIMHVLECASEPGERFEMAFRRKEQELMAAFAQLSVVDAMELHRRLSLCVDDDGIAARFCRLISERRARLLAFLACARRREALRGYAR